MRRSLAEEGAKLPSRKNIVVGAIDDGTSARKQQKRSERPKRRTAGMPTRPTPPVEGAAVDVDSKVVDLSLTSLHDVSLFISSAEHFLGG